MIWRSSSATPNEAKTNVISAARRLRSRENTSASTSRARPAVATPAMMIAPTKDQPNDRGPKVSALVPAKAIKVSAK